MCDWNGLVSKHRGQAPFDLKILRGLDIKMLVFLSEVRGLWTTFVFLYFAGLYFPTMSMHYIHKAFFVLFFVF